MSHSSIVMGRNDTPHRYVAVPFVTIDNLTVQTSSPKSILQIPVHEIAAAGHSHLFTTHYASLQFLLQVLCFLR